MPGNIPSVCLDSGRVDRYLIHIQSISTHEWGLNLKMSDFKRGLCCKWCQGRRPVASVFGEESCPIPAGYAVGLQLLDSPESSLLYFSFHFIDAPTVWSFGESSGLQTGHFCTQILPLRSHAAVCDLVFSCWNTQDLTWSLDRNICNLLYILSALMVTFQICKLPLPSALMHPHTIRLLNRALITSLCSPKDAASAASKKRISKFYLSDWFVVGPSPFSVSSGPEKTVASLGHVHIWASSLHHRALSCACGQHSNPCWQMMSSCEPTQRFPLQNHVCLSSGAARRAPKIMSIEYRFWGFC